MTKKKTDLSSEECHLFRQSVNINQFLTQDKHPIPKKTTEKRIPPEPNSVPAIFLGESRHLFEKLSRDDWLTAEDYIHFARTGIPSRVLHSLKRGHLPIEARIDLHGLTGDEFLEKMVVFLERCVQQGIRSVLVVHGKGGSLPIKPPILKNLASLWLREQPEVLAYYSAKPKDGGTGALYVLLKLRN